MTALFLTTALGCSGPPIIDEVFPADAGDLRPDATSPSVDGGVRAPDADAASKGTVDAPKDVRPRDVRPGSCEAEEKLETLTGPAVVQDTRLFSLGSERNKPGAHVPVIPAMAWTWSGEAATVRSLVKVELGSLPTDAEIIAATLVLNAEPGASNPPYYKGHQALNDAENDGWLLRVVEPWDPATATWDDQPKTVDMPSAPTRPNPDAVYVRPSKTSNETYSLDVTATVRQMHQRVIPNYGFMLRLRTEQYYASLAFCSTEHPDANLRPRLEVVYR